MSNLDALLGTVTSVNPQAARTGLTVLEFEEVTTSFRFIENGDGVFRGVGDSIEVEKNLLDSDTGELIGTKQAIYTAIKERGNGDVIARGEETITFNDGSKLFTVGRYNRTDNEAGETSSLRITDGTGIYEGAKGREFFTQVGEFGQNVTFDTTLVIAGVPLIA